MSEKIDAYAALGWSRHVNSSIGSEAVAGCNSVLENGAVCGKNSYLEVSYVPVSYTHLVILMWTSHTTASR